MTASESTRMDPPASVPGVVPSQTSTSYSQASQSIASKRRRTDDTIAPSSFEAHLTQLSAHDDTVFTRVDPSTLWKRPAVPADFSPRTHDLLFQQIEIDDALDAPIEGMPNPPAYVVPTLRLFGVTSAGHSVLAHIHGFLPYFYVPAPSGFEMGHLNEIQEQLALRIDGTRTSCLKVECVLRTSIYGYHHGPKARFLKVTCINPRNIYKARAILEGGFAFPSGQAACEGFESNLAYTLRFMIDAKVSGANWVEVKAGNYRKRIDKVSSCQIEVDIPYDQLISHPSDVGQYANVAPLRILSFDIECAGRKGIFPDAKIDPVIQIATMVTLQGSDKPFIRNVFTLKSCANIVGSHVLSFDTEQALLAAWQKFIKEVDPDVVTGYNILNFDFPYLLDRAETLKVSSFPFLGRLGTKTEAKDSRFSSKAYGTRENKAVNLDGRLQLDVLQVIQRDYKLRSYTLNAVSAEFLNEQKEDVPHSIITDLQNGNEDTRRRLAIYCLKDAYLPQRLLDKLMILINYIEMARVTGVPFNYLLTRGQQIKVVSQLYRKAAEHDLLIPAMKQEGGDDDPYEGATVLEPKTAYYDVPIATLDFSSLYPSIMMAHNLCYSTLLNQSQIARYNLQQDVDYIKTPSGDFFVKDHLAKGVLPIILEDLLSARKRAKADLKKETDPFRRAVLDGRQLALKISANSVYGFTGATVGKLPCIQISQSTTAFGREMIETTQREVEAKYTKANGYAHDADVIYGDTDSVMIKFGVDTLQEAMRLGLEASQYVTAKFKKPIKLEFEKVYWPYLLINKKRYAGLYWTNPDKYDKMDTKGIETVRRDNCQMVQIVIDTCLRKILIERDVDGAVKYAKQIISDLLQNRIDLSHLVITKALTKSKEEYDGKQAHVELAERMRKRDAGSAPAMGDRVAYVIVRASKGAAAYEKAEDPIYVLENNMPIDTRYYLENQLRKPLLRIFEPILKDADSMLLAGDHTRSIQIAAPTTGGLARFTVKRPTCLGCKTPLKTDTGALCSNCTKRAPEIYRKHLDQVNDMEIRFARLWTQCQRCQGSLHQDVLCTSRDCPIFYMRKKAAKDAQDAAATLQRFETW